MLKTAENIPDGESPFLLTFVKKTADGADDNTAGIISVCNDLINRNGKRTHRIIAFYLYLCYNRVINDIRRGKT